MACPHSGPRGYLPRNHLVCYFEIVYCPLTTPASETHFKQSMPITPQDHRIAPLSENLPTEKRSTSQHSSARSGGAARYISPHSTDLVQITVSFLGTASTINSARIYSLFACRNELSMGYLLNPVPHQVDCDRPQDALEKVCALAFAYFQLRQHCSCGVS